MAAWEAASPKTSEVVLDPGATPARETVSPGRVKLTVVTLLVLAACGSVAVSFDLQDLSLLVTAWSQLVAGLRTVFA